MTAPTGTPMSSPARDLLDEAAARALLRDGARPVDAAAALARARRARRDAARRRTSLVAAAAAVVLAVLAGAWVAGLPGQRRAEPAAPGTPLGLPDHVWGPPSWTPSVLDEPIDRASLLLSGVRLHAEPDDQSAVMFTRGFVVVSADGIGYRRLPQVRGASIVAAALSPSGRKVAWLEAEDGAAERWPTLVVLELATGAATRTELPGSVGPGVVSWLPRDGGVLVTGRSSSSSADREAPVEQIGWRVDPDGALGTPCLCAEDGVLVADPAGTARVLGTPGDAPGAVRTAVPQRVLSAADGRATTAVALHGVVFSPDGTRAAFLAVDAGASGGADLVVSRTAATDGAVDVTALPREVVGADRTRLRLVGWTSRGLLVAGNGLWRVDPGGAVVQRVSRASAAAPPIAGVAGDLAGATVRGPAPSLSHLSRAYVRYRWAASPMARVTPVGWARAGVVAVLLVVGVGGVVALHRRGAGPRGRSVAAGVAVVAVGTWLVPAVVPALLGPPGPPLQAARLGTPVVPAALPEVLPAPRLQPGMVLDDRGRVRAHRLSAAFVATVEDRQVVLALDSDTGALVRLPASTDQVPGVDAPPADVADRIGAAAVAPQVRLSPGGQVAVVLRMHERGYERMVLRLDQGTVLADTVTPLPDTAGSLLDRVLPLDDGTFVSVDPTGAVLLGDEPDGSGDTTRIPLPRWDGTGTVRILASGAGTAVVTTGDRRAWFVDLVGRRAARMQDVPGMLPGFAFQPGNTLGAPVEAAGRPVLWTTTGSAVLWQQAPLVPGDPAATVPTPLVTGEVTRLAPTGLDGAFRVLGPSGRDGAVVVTDDVGSPGTPRGTAVGVLGPQPGQYGPRMVVSPALDATQWSWATDLLAGVSTGVVADQPAWTVLTDRYVTFLLLLVGVPAVGLGLPALVGVARRGRVRRKLPD